MASRIRYYPQQQRRVLAVALAQASTATPRASLIGSRASLVSHIASCKTLPTATCSPVTRQLRLLSTSQSWRQIHPPQPQPTFPQNPYPPQAEPAPQPKKRSRVWKIIGYGSFLLLGATMGLGFRALVSPPPPLVPGSELDLLQTKLIHRQAEDLQIVKELSADPAWESWEAYETLSPEHRAQHISAGAMAGSSGIGGYHRVWYNRETGECVSVIFFGSATTGWPGVVHGGCLATLLDESCGRAAFKKWGGQSGLTANLQLNYVSATYATKFYIIRVKPRSDEELPEEERGKSHYKIFLDASIHEAKTGNATVVAEALFVGGKGKSGKGGLAVGGLADQGENARF
ncbi:HotDog domain-containing protein [Pseudoneurospora amorphoporcata]|uniref:HotDog domain-containing protein n=1 Tax=Pseudoneurospora amorphoporcata TaxID=241081 RepID=A0AAN6NZ81_9PEZI|nr:HotDog domain-containing protein [Pseudoneurospora amorphoporcata]